MPKEIRVPIPGMFSVSFVNEILRIGRENNFGSAMSIFYNSEWDWGVVFKGGDTVVYKEANAYKGET